MVLCLHTQMYTFLTTLHDSRERAHSQFAMWGSRRLSGAPSAACHSVCDVFCLPYPILHQSDLFPPWADEMAMTSDGRVTLSSPDHVSLLVHRTFNVSIPRHHIPTDQWEFEYGPAENDPEFGGADDMDVDITTDVHEDDVQAADQRGRWAHKVTGDRLGGKDRWLQFTVVGYAFFSSFLEKRVHSQ